MRRNPLVLPGVEWGVKTLTLTEERRQEIKDSFVHFLTNGYSARQAAALLMIEMSILMRWRVADGTFDYQWTTAERQRSANPALCRQIFLECLASSYNPSGAAEVAGMPLAYFEGQRSVDADFAEAWTNAERTALDELQGAIYQKALSGERGSEAAGMVLLNAFRPDTFRPKPERTAGVVQFNFVIGEAPKTRLIDAPEVSDADTLDS